VKALAATVPGAGPDAVAQCRAAVRDAFSPDGPLARGLAGFGQRPSQQQMALAVFDTIACRGTLAAEAGTGTGKTLAYLVPALLAGGKVLISAGTKALQDQIFDKDLPAVSRALGLHIDAALLKGRQNYVCRLRLERTAESGMLGSLEEVRALQQVVRFARESRSGDRAELGEVAESSAIWPAVTSTRDNCLGSECAHFDDCFVLQARRRALAADLVVVNHHLLLADMALREEAATELLPNADVVIVDEAHHLARIAADFFGDGWTLQQLGEFGADALRIGLHAARDGADWPGLVRALDSAARALRLALSEAGASPRARVAYERVARAPAVPQAMGTLDQALAMLQQALQQNQARDAELDLLLPRAQRLRQLLAPWLQAAVAPAPGAAAVVQWVSASTLGAHFHATPLDCAEPFARARAQREQAWILTSATLTARDSFEAFLRELGLAGAQALRWESPFDFARQALLYLPSPMPNPVAEDFAEMVAEAVWPVARASRGRAFVLCSTLRAVARVAQRLRDLMRDDDDELPLLVQGDTNRRALLADFRRLGNAVLVGSVSFWEGIDVRGDALSLVAIDKLPFAPPDDPVLAARVARLQAQGRNGFRDYQLPHAITLLRQGAGRLIRGEHDRGVLMILDERLLSRSYGSTILASLPPFARTRSEAEACAFVRMPAPQARD